LLKIKDFIFMDVVNVAGKKMGFIKDVLIDFNSEEVKGFVMSPYKIYNKNEYVLKENVISFNTVMIIIGSSKNNSLEFQRIKNMDIFDREGSIVGIAEDIIFNEENYKISGLIVSTGILRNFTYGKNIFLIRELILGDENLLYIGNRNNCNFFTTVHEIETRVELK
jgi:uncharacterized protein YrrD